MSGCGIGRQKCSEFMGKFVQKQSPFDRPGHKDRAFVLGVGHPPHKAVFRQTVETPRDGGLGDGEPTTEVSDSMRRGF